MKTMTDEVLEKIKEYQGASFKLSDLMRKLGFEVHDAQHRRQILVILDDLVKFHKNVIIIQAKPRRYKYTGDNFIKLSSD